MEGMRGGLTDGRITCTEDRGVAQKVVEHRWDAVAALAAAEELAVSFVP